MDSQTETNNLLSLSLAWKEKHKTVWVRKFKKETYRLTNGSGHEPSAMHVNVHHSISTTEDELNNHIKSSQPVNISHLLSSATKIGISRVDRLAGIKAMHKPNIWFLVFQG